MSGPDFTRTGQPVEWSASADLDERCRWEPDDPIADNYVAWWDGQRNAIKRHLTTVPHAGFAVVVRRAPARMADGWVVCYVRADRARPKAVAA